MCVLLFFFLFLGMGTASQSQHPGLIGIADRHIWPSNILAIETHAPHLLAPLVVEWVWPQQHAAVRNSGSLKVPPTDCMQVLWIIPLFSAKQDEELFCLLSLLKLCSLFQLPKRFASFCLYSACLLSRSVCLSLSLSRSLTLSLSLIHSLSLTVIVCFALTTCALTLAVPFMVCVCVCVCQA